MCLLIVLAGVDPDYRILVASNRDEARGRKAAPPGLFVGDRRRMLSPRDRTAGGTWLCVNDLGMFAGITNVAGPADRPGAVSRGQLPHLALDCDDLEAAVRAIEVAVEAQVFNAFQLILCDGDRTVVLLHEEGQLDRRGVSGGIAVVSNEHRLGELTIPGIESVAAPNLTLDERFDRVRPILLRTGADGGHRILKQGGDYGTVSSSWLAIRPGWPRATVWKYALGPPDEVPYRNYGNLARRLVEE